MKKQGYIKGAVIISAGGFISKMLGAVYRIPLVAFLGGTGMGIYQMVYPLYCILLTVSASGIPTGIARIISSGEGQGAERKAFYLYGGIGLIGSLFMFAFSGLLAKAQGEPAVEQCCMALSPSVFFVALISVVRGYFQGKGNMYPTAFTEVAEQVIKVAAGCALAGMYRGDVAKATSAAVFAVTISEVVTCVFAVALYYFGGGRAKRPLYRVYGVPAKSIFAYTVPLTLTAIALPLSQLAESIAVVNILRLSVGNATALYGIFSGCAVTIINLPVSIGYGLAAASVPQISPLAAAGDMAGAKKIVRKSLLYTLIISVPSAIVLFVFAPLAGRLLFSSLKEDELSLLVVLVRIMSVNAITSSLVQTSSACLTALGRPLFGTLTQWVSCMLRVGLSAALVAFTPLSVVGAAISANCCYFVAVVADLCYIRAVKRRGESTDAGNIDRFGNKARGLDKVG